MDVMPSFSGGRNIALKVPPHQYEGTIRFYRDVLGLAPATAPGGDAIGFRFGSCNLWIDRVETMSQAELWLEVVTDDPRAAATHLAEADVVRCDAIEPLPEGFKGFWIANPCGIVHLIGAQEQSWS
jgi:catechol 2,3-dioxygenase-like lactoylglutathione lyase family enzyme